jgi:hypothetical protein
VKLYLGREKPFLRKKIHKSEQALFNKSLDLGRDVNGPTQHICSS